MNRSSPWICIVLVPMFIQLSQPSKGQTSNQGKIYKSDDFGLSWQTSDEGFPPSDIVNAWLAFKSIVLLGTDMHGVWSSTDFGKHWSKSSDGLSRDVRITALVYHGNRVYAGTYRHGLFVSYDDGVNWSKVNVPQPVSSIRDLYSIGSVLLMGNDESLYVSQDAGRTWTKSVDQVQINQIISRDQILYVATNKGVIRSNDYGSNWASIFDRGAIYRIWINGDHISILDFFGNSFRSKLDLDVWLREELYFPMTSFIRLTPESPKIAPPNNHSTIVNNLNNSTGLPQHIPFGEVLITQFGFFTGNLRR